MARAILLITLPEMPLQCHWWRAVDLRVLLQKQRVFTELLRCSEILRRSKEGLIIREIYCRRQVRNKGSRRSDARGRYNVYNFGCQSRGKSGGRCKGKRYECMVSANGLDTYTPA